MTLSALEAWPGRPRRDRSRYVLHQVFRYEYPVPIRSLEHWLMVVPPRRHGDQIRVWHRLAVRGAPARVQVGRDSFGNHRFDIRAPLVAEAIEFESTVAVERQARLGPLRLPARALGDPRLRTPSRLTWPDAALDRAARDLRRGWEEPLALAERVSDWVHSALCYSHDATTVRTTASQALRIGAGVCQDYAHVMLALARRCGLAARYVSGHLVGEGGSHAWVEVLVPDLDRRGEVVVVPFDPTHARRAGSDYVTVAVGRDYADVAPTCGTFLAPCSGRLSSRKRLEVTAPAPEPVLVGA